MNPRRGMHLPISVRYARPHKQHPHVELEPRPKLGERAYAVIRDATHCGAIFANEDRETWAAVRADGGKATLNSRREARDWVAYGG